MSDTLTVRMYNVRFGDAILVTVPDRDPASGNVSKRRILIDVGNAPISASPEGGDDTVFKPVVEDILEQLGGQPLDLYVMTHEHLDHVQGLPHVAWKFYPDLAQRFCVERVWLTASSAPDYYETHPDAKKQKLAFDAMYHCVRKSLGMQPFPHQQLLLDILANNDSTKTTACVQFLRQLNQEKTTYLYRGVDLNGKHPFKEVAFEVWAPEEDTSAYYGRFQPVAAGAVPAEGKIPVMPRPVPPPGVDVGAFLNLVEARRNGIADNLLAIDQAANNTSVVFLLTWRGWRLLFAGDAELRSWKTMQKNGVLKPVHFLKVAHHGSHNGTPAGELFDAVLPTNALDNRERRAAISTWEDTYSGIPHTETNQRISSRCELHSTLDDKEKLFMDLEFTA